MPLSAGRSSPALSPWFPPQKYRGLMNFLSNVLREDGGFEYKKSIVEAILQLIREIPEAKEMGLAQVGGGWCFDLGA